MLPEQHHCRRATVLCVAMVTGLVYSARIPTGSLVVDTMDSYIHAQVNVLRVTKCPVIYYGMHNLIAVHCTPHRQFSDP